MSAWTHAKCEACWIADNGVIDDGGTLSIRRPTVLKEPEIEVCCFCGKYTIFGLFVRANPTTVLCGGDHMVRDDD